MKTEMLTLLSEIATDAGMTVLMVTHDPRDAVEFADQTILVVDGEVHQPQNTKALFANPPAHLRDYIGS
jgi:thiamine transport system ATP-binding protein